MASNKSVLISGKKLSRNVLWNLFGTGAPLLVAIVVIPMLIEGLGLERFGVLAIVWMVVGYFSLFDLGLGRALTKLVAERLTVEKGRERAALIWTAMLLLTFLGVFGALVVATISPWLTDSALNVPSRLRDETLSAFYLLAVSIPVVIGTAGLRGVLEAHQRFGLVNVVRIPLGISTFVGPLAVLPYSNSLVPVVTVLVIARAIAWFAYAVLCLRVEWDLRHAVGIDKVMIKPLISFGGWMTVTNIVSPLMVYLDRFFIGAVISMTAVTYYATPYEVVTRLLIVPAAFMGVMFPAFSSALAHDEKRAALLYGNTANYIFLALYPVVLIITVFAYDGMSLWLGVQFAENSSLVLQLLAAGVLLNSLANVPFGLVQGAGRPDLTAKLHMAELPFYLLMLWLLLKEYGIVGAAVAWVVRVAVDAVILFILANRLLPASTTGSWRLLVMASLALLSLGVGAVITEFSMKLLFLLLMLVVFVVNAWFVVLTKQEKRIICDVLRVRPVSE